ncbi:hypothetical protein H310_03314 [Aphanomyces invadans]|nr:hypothetical protein H310_03314 [Aphanomyces invadans]ETW05564.1 hypothetical protein H310_03314 [Aphanomyces invadans]|eukprot:XP_008865341.1 hypothetical protein H310_03314 [Aphanomyces invadans]
MRARELARGVLKDPENIPLLAMVTLALAMGTATAARFLMASPDIRLNKAKRENPLYHLSEEEKKLAEGFAAHRHALANLSMNPINRDSSFEAEHTRASGA